MFFGSTATSFPPRRSAALRLACRKSSMPCSAMILAASCARARRRSSARCENFLAIGHLSHRPLEYRFLAFRVVRVLPLVQLGLGQIPLDEIFHDAVGVVRARQQAGRWRNTYPDNAIVNGDAMHGSAGRRVFHGIGPSRYRRATALLTFTYQTIRVETHPYRRYHVDVEAIVPCVMRIVACNG